MCVCAFWYTYDDEDKENGERMNAGGSVTNRRLRPSFLKYIFILLSYIIPFTIFISLIPLYIHSPMKKKKRRTNIIEKCIGCVLDFQVKMKTQAAMMKRNRN